MAVLDSTTESAKQLGRRFHPSRFHLDRDASARLALIVFLAAEVAMFITVLVLEHNQWFKPDDWDFLELRNAGSITSLFAPHNGHWSTLPILEYRALFHLVGLTFWPYQVIVILLHLIAAALLRIVMRRANVGPWMATIVASVFVLFGAGYQNIIGSFDVGLDGSLVFGLTQLLLADHDGPIDRRDWLAILAGLAGLMCSNLSVTIVFAVGLATLIRRGWRPALFQTGPLAVVWLIWYFGIGRPTYSPPSTFSNHLSLSVNWFTTGVRASFEAMGQYAGVGVALAVLLVVGLVLAWSRLNRQELRTQAAAPAALLLTAFVFMFSTGWEKVLVHGVSDATESRYLYDFAAMALPAMAVAANALVSRWRVLIPVVLGLLVIGIPGNLQTLAAPPYGWSPSANIAERQYVQALATVPVAHEVPRSALTYLCPPACTYFDQLHIGWLLDQKAAGRLPNAGPVSSTTRADATLQLALQQSKIFLGSGAAGRRPGRPSRLPRTRHRRLSTLPTIPSSAPSWSITRA
jgi:MFS family permease